VYNIKKNTYFSGKKTEEKVNLNRRNRCFVNGIVILPNIKNLGPSNLYFLYLNINVLDNDFVINFNNILISVLNVSFSLSLDGIQKRK
jgi:hypothetical protein